MIKRLMEIWHSPRDVEEAEWYMLTAGFIATWIIIFLHFSN